MTSVLNEVSLSNNCSEQEVETSIRNLIELGEYETKKINGKICEKVYMATPETANVFAKDCQSKVTLNPEIKRFWEKNPGFYEKIFDDSLRKAEFMAKIQEKFLKVKKNIAIFRRAAGFCEQAFKLAIQINILSKYQDSNEFDIKNKSIAEKFAYVEEYFRVVKNYWAVTFEETPESSCVRSKHILPGFHQIHNN